MSGLKYQERGVSSSKTEVWAALGEVDQGLFPGAFCKIVPDYLTGSQEHGIVLHADGAGTKSSLAYVHYAETGDAGVFRGIAQDSLVMNLDDMICVGALGPFVLSNTIGRNANLIPGEVLNAVIGGYQDVAARLLPYGIEIVPCGGETADLGDVVRTVIADSTLVARLRRDQVIDAAGVKPGHDIVGLASGGPPTAWEESENSGIGTNGFTALRHGLLSRDYREELPETFAPDIYELAYAGRLKLGDPVPGSSQTVGEACLSPTRTYAPVVKRVLEHCRREVSALFHNTGGGQTKCLRFGDGVRYEKTHLFPTPPLFELIRRETNASWKEMCQVFNLGHRLEIVCAPEVSDEIIAIAGELGIEGRVVGRVTSQATGRSLVVEVGGETLEFQGDT